MSRLIAVLLLALVVCPAVQAVPLEYEVRGHVTYVDDPDGLYGSDLSVWDTFTGTIVYDDTLTDTNADPDRASYPTFPPTGASGLTFNVGDLSGNSDPDNQFNLNLRDRAVGDYDDLDFNSAIKMSGTGFTEASGSFGITLQDPTGTALSDDSLPSSIDLADWSTHYLSMYTYNDGSGDDSYFNVELEYISLVQPVEMVSFDVLGVVSYIDDPDGILSDVVVGDDFSGVMTYDRNLPDTNPDPDRASYPTFAPTGETGFTYTMGGVTGFNDPTRQFNLNLHNREVGDYDDFDMNAHGLIEGRDGYGAFGMVLQDPTGTALSTDDLPSSFDLSEWSTRYLTITYGEGSSDDAYVLIDLLDISPTEPDTRPIPEPASLALLGLGALALCRRRRA